MKIPLGKYLEFIKKKKFFNVYDDLYYYTYEMVEKFFGKLLFGIYLQNIITSTNIMIKVRHLYSKRKLGLQHM